MKGKVKSYAGSLFLTKLTFLAINFNVGEKQECSLNILPPDSYMLHANYSIPCPPSLAYDILTLKSRTYI